MKPRAHAIRFKVDPRDVPPIKAARCLGLTEAAFDSVKGRLFERGFPRPDEDTGLYDLKAIGLWQDRRSGLAGDDRSEAEEAAALARFYAFNPQPSRRGSKGQG